VFYAHTLDPKATASGYNHTYFDHAGVDLILLATIPSDSEITGIAEVAAHEADSLLALVGINTHQVYLFKGLPNSVPPPVSLPPIMAWYERLSESEESLTFNSDSEMDGDIRDSDDEEVLVDEIRQIIRRDAEEAPITRRNTLDKQMEQLTAAALTVITDDAMRV
jgi:hypothetical protein